MAGGPGGVVASHGRSRRVGGAAFVGAQPGSAGACRSSRSPAPAGPGHVRGRTTSRRAPRRPDHSRTGRLHRPDPQGRLDGVESSRSRPGSGSTTPTTSTTTRSSSPRSRTQLASCKSTKRDMIVLTDWMAARMIELGWIQTLDHRKMPNVTQEPDRFARGTDWDPNREYSVPWQSGMTGIATTPRSPTRVTSFTGAAHPVRPQGQGRRCSPRCATRWASCSCTVGRGSRELHADAEFENGHRRAARLRRQRSASAVHRQRLPRRPRSRATSWPARRGAVT